MYLNNRIVYSIAFLILSLAVLYTIKPHFMFDHEGNLIPFGAGEGKTIYSFGVVTVVLAVMGFFIFSVVDLVSLKK